VIVVDTNVLSEPLRVRPNPGVLEWLDLNTAEVFVTAVTVGELLTGVGALPAGRRRVRLQEAVDHVLAAYSERVLPYDFVAARYYAQMRLARRVAGVPLAVEDGMIAAICAAGGAHLATRNVRDFIDLGLKVINPWRNVSGEA
jgi:toxin FitB